MKKIISILVLTTFIFSSCSKGEELVSDTPTKADYLIKIANFDSFKKDIEIRKVGKLKGSQDIKLSSQAIGRVAKIYVKEGQKVNEGQILVGLSDTVANYGINLEKAKNTLEKIKINYDSTKLTLDKQIFDSEIALEKLKNSLETSRLNSSIDIIQAEDNLSNLDYFGTDTKSSLELAKLDQSIKKLELDYNNSLVNNQETIYGFKKNISKEKLTQNIFLNDTITFGDKLLDATGKYREDIFAFKDFLGAKDLGQKTQSTESLFSLIKYMDDHKNISLENIEDKDIITNLLTLDSGYTKISSYLESIEKTLLNSIVSVGKLSQAQIDGYLATVNAYQTQFAANYSAFTAFKNSSSSFVKTYESNQVSMVKQLELLKKDREIALKNYELTSSQSKNTLSKVVNTSGDAIKSLDLQIKQTEDSIELAKKSRDLTLKGLENSLNEVRINQKLALKDYDKLSIKAPISGVISDIMVDKGADISTGMPVLTLIGTNNSEVEISFKESELDYVEVGMKTYIKVSDKKYEGTIYSISSVADNNLNFKANIVFNKNLNSVGGIADIFIPIKSEYILLPINIIEVGSKNTGFINILSGTNIEKIPVTLGNIYDNKIEIIPDLTGTGILNPETKLILTDVLNFDENKFQIKIEQ